jgi:hypothetical protein
VDAEPAGSEVEAVDLEVKTANSDADLTAAM